jgi:hypothetical protein
LISYPESDCFGRRNPVGGIFLDFKLTDHILAANARQNSGNLAAKK